MEPIQIDTPMDFKNLFDFRRENLKQVMSKEVKEIVDNEFNLTEFNLFISSIGKAKIAEATKEVAELRRAVDNGEIDLTEYEEMAEDF